MEKCEKSIETVEKIGQFFTPPAHLIEISYEQILLLIPGCLSEPIFNKQGKVGDVN
jgi:hypothetical protein